MSTKLFVGNLPFSATEAELETIFNEYGAVSSAKIITDRETGRPRGFGFVEFGDADAARKAIDGLNGQSFNGRPLVVNEAKPQERRGFGGGDGGGGGRGGYGGGGGGGGRGGFGGGGRDDRGRGGSDRW